MTGYVNCHCHFKSSFKNSCNVKSGCACNVKNSVKCGCACSSKTTATPILLCTAHVASRRKHLKKIIFIKKAAVFDVAGAATFDAVLDLAGAATFDVAAVFEVAAAVAFEAAVEVDVPRHIALPNVSGV